MVSRGSYSACHHYASLYLSCSGFCGNGSSYCSGYGITRSYSYFYGLSFRAWSRTRGFGSRCGYCGRLR